MIAAFAKAGPADTVLFLCNIREVIVYVVILRKGQINMRENKQDSKKKSAAIILSAGIGKRMNSNVPKQYLLLENKPILYYTIRTFEESRIDAIVLVTGKGDEEYCQKEIVEKYGFQKVIRIVHGGKERYHSVYQGLKALDINRYDYVFIHDGARPFVSNEIIENAFSELVENKACVVGVPVKDTIKIVDENGFVIDTPRRDQLYQVQTPQVFNGNLIWEAYSRLIAQEESLLQKGIKITDDAMVVEALMNYKVKVIAGSYNNIKITTPDDLIYAKNLV